METPGLDIRQMFGQVRADVDQSTQGAQTPWVNEAIIGSFAMAGTIGNPAPAKTIAVDLLSHSSRCSKPPAQPSVDVQSQVQSLFQASADEHADACCSHGHPTPDQSAPVSSQQASSTSPAWTEADPAQHGSHRVFPAEWAAEFQPKGAICNNANLATLDQNMVAAYNVTYAAQAQGCGCRPS